VPSHPTPSRCDKPIQPVPHPCDGQDLGIGADRSQGEGTFDVDSIEHEGVAEGAIGKEAVIA